MIRTGDVVSLSGKGGPGAWVVADFHGAPLGQYVRAVRWSDQSKILMTSFLCGTDQVTVLERVAFEQGEVVKAGARTGTIVAVGDDIALVHFDPQVRITRDGESIWSEGWEENAPIWKLVLENKL